ncbi:anti-sigma regulatory factor (Ser/Thr protein kinase) [Micromonospora pisi]|uniref:Anti-sigma regulatory factor (Ser/Thr protein kinase) n=1 Tax=Micromonospora pisi TaxID=589240 RepID=A0A495JU46_9ACTN|nr:sensor histidine kinase [Micromonospora pisi]RKR92526.1 anti-sigma regulatory factor (Ser/Thr protein kinase) [Micromonospora pisi]
MYHSRDLHEFVHPALFYANRHEYLAGTIPFVRAGLAAGEPVMVAVPEGNLELIRDALGADAARVQLHDMAVAGRNPGRIIPRVLLAFADAHPDRRVRIIGEPVWAGRTAAEYPACAQHEALINAAFAGRCATILCPYDTGRLDRNWLDDAYRTHPVLRTAADAWDSPHYADPITVADGFNLPLPPSPPHAETLTVDLHALWALRRLVTAQALAAGLAPDRVADLTLAVNELAANTVEHTGAGGTFSVWTTDKQLICQLADTGHISEPLAGRIPAPADQLGGRGLLLVNELCDLVRVHTRPGATTVRVHMYR